jgi:hypothetical protein
MQVMHTLAGLPLASRPRSAVSLTGIEITILGSTTTSATSPACMRLLRSPTLALKILASAPHAMT